MSEEREIYWKRVMQGCPLSPTFFNIYLEDLMKNCFLNTGDVNIRGRKMLKNVLMELNYRCEDYGMNININKTKTMVIRRKPKIDMRIKDESVEQLDSFKYLGCNISSNLNYCQRVKQRIAIAKEGFNRKRLVKFFVWSVVL